MLFLKCMYLSTNECKLQQVEGYCIILYLILGTWVTWRRISLFVAIPAIMVCAWNAWEKEKEHASHGRGEFTPYNHLRIRSKV